MLSIRGSAKCQCYRKGRRPAATGRALAENTGQCCGTKKRFPTLPLAAPAGRGRWRGFLTVAGNCMICREPPLTPPLPDKGGGRGKCAALALGAACCAYEQPAFRF